MADVEKYWKEIMEIREMKYWKPKPITFFGDNPLSPDLPVTYFMRSKIVTDNSELGREIAERLMRLEPYVTTTLGEFVKPLADDAVIDAEGGIARQFKEHKISVARDLKRFLGIK